MFYDKHLQVIKIKMHLNSVVRYQHRDKILCRSLMMLIARSVTDFFIFCLDLYKNLYCTFSAVIVVDLIQFALFTVQVWLDRLETIQTINIMSNSTSCMSAILIQLRKISTKRYRIESESSSYLFNCCVIELNSQ